MSMPTNPQREVPEHRHFDTAWELPEADEDDTVVVDLTEHRPAPAEAAEPVIDLAAAERSERFAVAWAVEEPT